MAAVEARSVSHGVEAREACNGATGLMGENFEISPCEVELDWTLAGLLEFQRTAR